MKFPTKFSLTLLGLTASCFLLAIQPNIPVTMAENQSNLIINKTPMRDGHSENGFPIRSKTRRTKLGSTKDSTDKNVSSPVQLLQDGDDRRTVMSPVETDVSTVNNDRRSYEYGMGYQPSYATGFHAVDFSPLFIALIPIALFLGAAAAFALSVATTSSSASASAQQQQQQEESSNNNNAANSNNNNALLAALLASNTNNNNNQPTFIIVNNATGQIIPYYFGRALADKFHFSWPRLRPRRRFRRTHLLKKP